MAKNASFVLSSFSAAQWPAADRPEVAFVGRSNVGKSSCLNTLLGRSDMARVSKTPGRTQSINFFDLEHQGRELRFADLPGYGFAKAPKRVKKDWDRMIGEYLRDRASLALVVVLVDIRREPTVLDRQMIGWLEEAERTGLLVITKSDKFSDYFRRMGTCFCCCLPRFAASCSSIKINFRNTIADFRFCVSAQKIR